MDKGSDRATSLDVRLNPLCPGPTPDLCPPRPLDFVKPAAGNGPDADNPDQCLSIYLQSIWYHGWPHSPRAERIHPALQPNLLKQRSNSKWHWANVSNIFVGTVLTEVVIAFPHDYAKYVYWNSFSQYHIIVYSVTIKLMFYFEFSTFHSLPPNCPNTWCEIILNTRLFQGRLNVILIFILFNYDDRTFKHCHSLFW